MSTEISQENRNFFSCKYCDYTTVNKYDFFKHTKTTKHQTAILSSKSTDLSTDLSKKSTNRKFKCENCNKHYKDKSGLWRHKNTGKCNTENVETTNSEILHNETNDITDKELIVMLIKQNSELMKETYDFKSMMMEVIKNGTHNTNTTTTNSHNKTFNLQFFLNETCKDAMNIMDFVDSIKLQLSDLENVGKLGYVEGISNIITTNLKALDVEKRPIHCADKKREVVYIKDEDKWEKEDENKKKFRKAIKRVASKNQRLIPKFKEAHPDCLKSASKFSDQYNKIIVESMGGSGDNDEEKEDKIIRNISKHVIIDK
jgi:hypothetical protein